MMWLHMFSRPLITGAVAVFRINQSDSAVLVTFSFFCSHGLQRGSTATDGSQCSKVKRFFFFYLLSPLKYLNFSQLKCTGYSWNFVCCTIIQGSLVYHALICRFMVTSPSPIDLFRKSRSVILTYDVETILRQWMITSSSATIRGRWLCLHRR